MLFFTNQILKLQKQINHREHCHHVKQFILASANSCNVHILFICYVIYCTFHVSFSFLLIALESMYTVHSNNPSLFCQRSIIGRLKKPAATAENEEKYTYSNIIYIGFQNSYSFLKFSLISIDKQLFLKGRQIN